MKDRSTNYEVKGITITDYNSLFESQKRMDLKRTGRKKLKQT